MPPETDDNTAASTTPTYTFPFDVPADLAAADEQALRALHTQVREHAPSLASATPQTAETVAGLRACRDLAVAIATELNERAAMATEAADVFAELEGAALPEPADAPAATEPEGDADGGDDADADGGEGDAPAEPEPAAPAAVTASSGNRRPTPPVRAVASRGRSNTTAPAPRNAAKYASMRASAEVPGFRTGQTLTTFSEAAQALTAVLDRYPKSKANANRRGGWSNGQRPVEVFDPESPEPRTFSLQRFARHSVVEIQREFPDELRVRDDEQGYNVAQFAARESRLPGGNLLNSAKKALSEGRALTAAAGWCAPSDVIYQLLETETLDGMLDLPELQTTRGGWQIPDNGGPDFASIYDSIGNAGDTHLSETQVINDTSKHCTEIPCPDFSDVRLGVDYVCITGGLLQRRGYPEAVARFGRGAVVALAHKINKGVIADIVTGSGSAITIPQDLSGDDAASATLSGVELAIVDMGSRNKMGMNTTMEVVMPWWVLQPIRAGLARRRGVAMLDVSDEEILAWFTRRRAVPRLVYDWQDASSGLTTGPGGAAALTRLPATMQFLVYPAGTWVKAVQDVVSLDTIYDSTQLETNQYTALFAEDGWAMLKMAPLSRRYTVNVDPSGVTGCCDNVGS